MKLPSGREIPIDSLADVAETLATESFYMENVDEAEETVTDTLRSKFFSLSGTETPVYSSDDISAILDIVRPIAEEIGGELSEKLGESRSWIKTSISRKLTPIDVEIKHKLLTHLETLGAAVNGLSRLYEAHPELNDQTDISLIIPMSLDEWDTEITMKIEEIEKMEV